LAVNATRTTRRPRVALVVDDALDEILAAAASRRGSADSADGVRRASSGANGIANGSIGDGVAMANQHRVEGTLSY